MEDADIADIGCDRAKNRHAADAYLVQNQCRSCMKLARSCASYEPAIENAYSSWISVKVLCIRKRWDNSVELFQQRLRTLFCWKVQMDVLFTIACAIVVIGFLVIIHEGGHFLAAKAFGVRVTELMVGLPGPSVSKRYKGTKFGITAVPLGGYAKVCGMETGEMSPYLKQALKAVYEKGSITSEELAQDLSISDDDAAEALEELVEWGTITVDRKHFSDVMYMTCGFYPESCQKRIARRLSMGDLPTIESGSPMPIEDVDGSFEREYAQTYRSKPFWKKSVILLAGIAMNLLFAMLAFIIIYSVIGVDVVNTQNGQTQHIVVSPIQSIQAGFNCIVMTFQAIISLFNPQTAAETVSNSTSIVGIAVMSADYFAQGFVYALFFMAIVSVSLGLMNLLPIPPLDGGRFLIEIIQRITHRQLSTRALGYISMVGMALFICFFIFMLNQDIQRFVFGNW